MDRYETNKKYTSGSNEHLPTVSTHYFHDEASLVAVTNNSMCNIYRKSLGY